MTIAAAFLSGLLQRHSMALASRHVSARHDWHVSGHPNCCCCSPENARNRPEKKRGYRNRPKKNKRKKRGYMVCTGDYVATNTRKQRELLEVQRKNRLSPKRGPP
ncbi:hypothetical protein COO60DRAFT_1544217 [Scenedesmus sp. NREL 46B-D3]|nr:hypothetical protein COO60DRAFT_1544217 [Scenedesmus sp. NREL 46B-D3]